MSRSTRNSLIYLGIAIAVLFLASRLVTVGLMLIYAPEDAAQFFYLKQFALSAVCVGLILWLWSKRTPQAVEKDSGQ